MLGSGAIIVVDDSVPIVSVALRLAEFYRHESCGKCVPCREGTNWTVKMLERIDRGEATPMDLDVMANVQDNIIGNCLCVLGDSMAMPVGSMIKHFRPEFEAHIEEAARRRALRGSGCEPPRTRLPDARPATGSRSRSTAARCARRRASGCSTPPSAATSRSPTSVTSRKLGAPGRRLPHVHGRDRGHAEAADVLLHAGQGRHGRLHADRPREARAERGRRVPARQPPARLPGLRQGRRVPAAGHLLRLGPGPQPLRRATSATSRSRSRSRR